MRNKKDKMDFKYMLLVWAIMKNKMRFLNFIIGTDVDINKKIYGFTPVECACIYQNITAIKLLVAAGCKLNYRGSIVCHVLAEWNQYKDLKWLVKKGLDVNVRDCNGRTGLHWAAEKGSVESVEVLLDSGADVNVMDGDNMTPLTIACMDGEYEIIELLLKCGANVNCQDGEGHTPLYHAKEKQRKNIQQLLLTNGANLD